MRKIRGYEIDYQDMRGGWHRLYLDGTGKAVRFESVETALRIAKERSLVTGRDTRVIETELVEHVYYNVHEGKIAASTPDELNKKLAQAQERGE